MPTATDTPGPRIRARRPDANATGARATGAPWLITALIAFAALAHGAVEPWALTAVHLALFAALATVMARRLHRPRARTLPASPAALPGLVCFALLGLASLFSLCPPRSWLELARIGACGVLFFLASLGLRRRAEVFATAWGLALFGAAFATLGLIDRGPDLLGFRIFQHASDRMSLTFVNPNHTAALLSMLACLTLGLAVARRGARRGLLLLCALYLGTAVVFTASRAGMLAMVTGFALLLGGLLLLPPAGEPPTAGRRRPWLPIAGTAAAIALLAAVLGPRLPVERLATLGDPLAAGEKRWQLWTAAWELAAARPWTGSGPGTFQDAVAPYQPRRLADHFLQHAHNDYLELAAEAGFPALAAALATFAVFTVAAVRGLARAEAGRQAVGLGALAGICALMVHSTADFNLHIPANAWLVVVLAALCQGAAGAGGEASASGLRGRAALAGFILAAAALVAALAVLSPYLASRRLERSRQLMREGQLQAARATLEPAARWPLADPAIHTQLGALELALALEEGAAEVAGTAPDAPALESALRHHRTACSRCPVRAEAFLQLAAPARLAGRLEEAEEALEHAVELAPLDAGARFQLAGLKLAQGAEGRALASYGRALELDPRLVEPAFESLSRAGWPVDRIRDGLPAVAAVREALADVLEQRDLAREATEERRRAYQLEPTPARASRHLEALAESSDDQAALTLSAEYQERFPRERSLIRQAISFAHRLERPDVAAGLYRRWVRLDPANPRPYASLGALLCHDRYREALEVFAEGEDRTGGDGALSLRLGLCHRRHGRGHLALEALMRAAALAPGEALIRYHLGEQFRLLGLEAQAAEEFRACLEIDPELGRCRKALARRGA